jgi:hypothetical protein
MAFVCFIRYSLSKTQKPQLEHDCNALLQYYN